VYALSDIDPRCPSSLFDTTYITYFEVRERSLTVELWSFSRLTPRSSGSIDLWSRLALVPPMGGPAGHNCPAFSCQRPSPSSTVNVIAWFNRGGGV
jgi:hypothetical protein